MKDDNNLCVLYTASCSTGGTETNGGDVFAKSGFYEAPQTAASRCTHFEIYNANPTIAFYCKNINDDATDAEGECKSRGNCRILKVTENTCSTTAVDSSIVPTTNSNVAYTAKSCV
jgi:hypothetical protein